jgi:phosphatidate cytidylyltransferase
VAGRDRLITAAVALPLLAAGVIFLPPWGLALILGLVAAAGQWELYRMHFPKNLPGAAWVALAGGVLVVAATPSGQGPTALAAAALAVPLVRMLSGRAHATALAETGVLALGLLYVAFLLSHVAALHAAPHGVRWVFYLLLVTWTGDATAYWVGSRFGQRRLTEISPGKTVEGTLGGIGASVLAAYLGMTFAPGLSALDPLWLGLGLGVLAVLGDLTESLFKRGAGIKDSGTLFPGHGGVLDKLDSFLFTAPALFYYLSAFVWAPGGS